MFLPANVQNKVRETVLNVLCLYLKYPDYCIVNGRKDLHNDKVHTS